MNRPTKALFIVLMLAFIIALVAVPVGSTHADSNSNGPSPTPPIPGLGLNECEEWWVDNPEVMQALYGLIIAASEGDTFDIMVYTLTWLKDLPPRPLCFEQIHADIGAWGIEYYTLVRSWEWDLWEFDVDVEMTGRANFNNSQLGLHVLNICAVVPIACTPEGKLHRPTSGNPPPVPSTNANSY
jgi:hypothetical protein